MISKKNNERLKKILFSLSLQGYTCAGAFNNMFISKRDESEVYSKNTILLLNSKVEPAMCTITFIRGGKNKIHSIYAKDLSLRYRDLNIILNTYDKVYYTVPDIYGT